MVDLTSGGIFAAGLGACSEVVKGAMGRVDKVCEYIGSGEGSYWRDRYMGMLREFTGFESVALFSTGGEVCSAFWRVVRVYTGKPGVWGGLVDPDDVGRDDVRCDAFHGWGLDCLIMAGRISWRELGIFPELGEGRFGTTPDRTGGMIMEPYHGPSGQFHRIKPTIERVRTMGETYSNIPLCVDEVQGGFGRTGRLWAHEWYVDRMKVPEERYLRPAFVACGKLMGGGLPLSALLGPKEVMESDSVKEFGNLHSTHSGNPVMCSVGCAVIEAIVKGNLIVESERKGDLMHVELGKLSIRTHGKGLMAGLEFRDRDECRKAVGMCRERGVRVVDTGRKWIKLGPELTIEDDILMAGVKIVCEVVEEVVNAREVAPCGGVGEESSGVGADLPGNRLLTDTEREVGGVKDGG